MKQSNKITFTIRTLLRVLFITLYTVFSMRLQEGKNAFLIIGSIMDVSLLSHQTFLPYEPYAFCNGHVSLFALAAGSLQTRMALLPL